MRNFTARQNLVKMKKGDRVFFYHSNEGKEIVGIAEIIKEAYPDPTDKTGKFVCVDIKADEPLEDTGDHGRDQGRQETRRHGAGEIFAAVGAAGDGGRVEDRLQDGRTLIGCDVRRIQQPITIWAEHNFAPLVAISTYNRRSYNLKGLARPVFSISIVAE